MRIKSVAVPCGKCPACRENRINDWLFRIQNDVEFSPNAFFVTLTYDDEHLPENNLVNKKDVQDFFKRLRSKCEPEHIDKLPNGKYLPLRYFLCSEYGTERNRPHYHAIIWNIAPLINNYEWNEFFSSAWQNGFVYLGQVTPASIRYVLKYMFKDAELSEVQKDSLFYFMSKKIGLNFIENGNNQRNIHDRFVPYLSFDTGRKRIPRYYKEKIWSDRERRRIAYLAGRALDPFQSLVDIDIEEYQKYLAQERERKNACFDNFERRKRLAAIGVRTPTKLKG